METAPKPRKVLLIDDDRLQYALTKQQFKSFGIGEYELEWCATYEEGLDRLLKGDYTVCLLDYRLGERDGLELIREAIENDCHVPIIFLTAETGAAVDIEAMNAGALDYLVKGEFSAPMLERSIRYALKLSDTLGALRRLATRDQLTGLLNRRMFDEILGEEIVRSERFGRPFSLILIDIDHFKNVNDTHGHLVGDTVLREVARRMDKMVRSVDRVMRYGGEEFAILMLEGDERAAEILAEKVRVAIESSKVSAGGELSLPITISAGVADFPSDARDAEGLISSADEALYAAKKNGRNRVVSFGSASR